MQQGSVSTVLSARRVFGSNGCRVVYSVAAQPALFIQLFWILIWLPVVFKAHPPSPPPPPSIHTFLQRCRKLFYPKVQNFFPPGWANVFFAEAANQKKIQIQNKTEFVLSTLNLWLRTWKTKSVKTHMYDPRTHGQRHKSEAMLMESLQLFVSILHWYILTKLQLASWLLQCTYLWSVFVKCIPQRAFAVCSGCICEQESVLNCLPGWIKFQ